MSKEKLLPCPFCGGEAHFDRDDNGWNWIECGQCHTSTNATVSAMEDCKPGLVEAWNRRASLPSPDYQRGQEEMRERVIKVVEKSGFNHCSCVDREKCASCATVDEILDAIRALPAQQESVCEWKPRTEYTWDTGCGIRHNRDATPFCPYCGRPIRLGGGELDSDVATAVKAGINGTGNDGY